MRGSTVILIIMVEKCRVVQLSILLTQVQSINDSIMKILFGGFVIILVSGVLIGESNFPSA